MRQVLAAVRAAGIQVFIAPHHRWRESDPYTHWQNMPPVQEAAAKGASVRRRIVGREFSPRFRASLQFNLPSYVNAIVTTGELVTELSA